MFHTHLVYVGYLVSLVGIPLMIASQGPWWILAGILMIVVGKLLKRSVRWQKYVAIVLYAITIGCGIMMVACLFASDFPHPIDGLRAFKSLFNAHPFLPVARAMKSVWHWLGQWVWWLVATIACWLYAFGEEPSKKAEGG